MAMLTIKAQIHVDPETKAVLQDRCYASPRSISCTNLLKNIALPLKVMKAPPMQSY